MVYGEGFGSLSPDEQEAVRQAQRRRKLEKQQAKEANRRGKEQARQGQSSEEPQRRQKVEDGMGSAGLPTAACRGGVYEDPLEAVAAYPDQISMDSYFGACPGGLFCDPGLPPTELSLELLMAVLQVRQLGVASASRPDHFILSVPTCMRARMCTCTALAPSLTCTRTVHTRALTH